MAQTRRERKEPIARNDKEAVGDFERNVFVNCPFDQDYRPLLEALIFTLLDCGFVPRIATERTDSGEVRIEKIKKLVKVSRYGVHDISRAEPLQIGDLPRFNMPFELGLDVGCREYGRGKFGTKKCLIFERSRFQYHKVLSDISGQDIEPHDNQPEKLTKRLRDWLNTNTEKNSLPPGTRIWQRFNDFQSHFEAAAVESGYDSAEIHSMTTSDFREFVSSWLAAEP